MSSIIVNGVTTANNLPFDADLKTYLESHPATAEWFQMDPEHCDLNGASIQRIRSIGSGKSVFAPDGGVPTLTPFDSYAGFTALTLPGNSTQRFSGPVIPALSSDFTIIVVAARSGGITAPGKWINWGDSSGSETRLQYASDGSIQAFHRGRGITIAAPTAPDDKPRMNLMSFDGKNLRGRSNSGVIATSADVTGALPATGNTFIGGVGANYPRGSMSDVVILNTDLLAAVNADIYALWRELFSDVYAINLEL